MWSSLLNLNAGLRHQPQKPQGYFWFQILSLVRRDLARMQSGRKRPDRQVSEVPSATAETSGERERSYFWLVDYIHRI